MPLKPKFTIIMVHQVEYLPYLGERFRQARKRRFPGDDLQAFALRIGVARATLQKMEKGDLSVSLARYYQAAVVLGTADNFAQLFTLKESLFDD